ncbi:MAG: DUF2298 domain-containing protein [Anaerolineales bacterium]
MPTKPRHASRLWIYDVAFALVLVLAAALRLTGIAWDDQQHLHPDERFLTQVESALQPATSIGQYFDTLNSPLNPGNRGYTFFVYGTFPIFLVRYVAESLQQTGYDQVHLIGRAFSALADLGVVALVYLIGNRLFDKRVGLLAAVFSAFTVMQIQQSHFWTVDNFANLFTLLTVYFAIRIARDPGKDRAFNVWDFVGFGVGLGLSFASKLSIQLAALLPAMLAAAVVIRMLAQPIEKRSTTFVYGGAFAILAGLVSLLVFRVFQPYAFLGLSLNPAWMDTMRQLSAQVSGLADWPPSMQWARRPLWFGLQNIVAWGLGWPLAIVCFAGFIWAGWRILKGDWNKPQAILWLYTAIFLGWQSLGFNPTMRYFLPVYPGLAVFGAWGVFALWDVSSKPALGAKRAKKAPRWQDLAQPAAAVLVTVAVLGAAAWSLAFVQVYRQDVSRIAAARWIYQNIPGPITIGYERDGELAHQPIPVSYDYLITAQTPLFTQFSARADGELQEVTFKYVLAPVQISLSNAADPTILLARQNQLVDLLGMQPGDTKQVTFTIPVNDPAATYHLQLTLPNGDGQLTLQSAELRNSQSADLAPQSLAAESPLALGEILSLDFSLNAGASYDQLVVTLRAESQFQLDPARLNLRINTAPEMDSPVVDESLVIAPTTNKGAIGTEQTVQLGAPIIVTEGQTIYVQVSLDSPGAVMLLGSALANETSWDDGLPLRMDGYDGFGGIYQGDLNYEMYWDEDPSKLERFTRILNNTEYIFITSNRQWGSLPRIPERFPLVIAYYRALLGCPGERSIESCYVEAQVGDFDGELGFELVQVFESGPHLGPWRINDQGAEEAFTVYDHPKVLIFHKTADYDAEKVAAILGAVDLSQVMHVTPGEAGDRVLPNLMLSPERSAQLRAGGTWSELFDTSSWVNASPWLSAIVWYVALFLLGVAVYPLARFTLPGLKDGGYPFARLVGLLLLSYFAWMGGSLGLTFSRAWLAIFVLVLIGLSALAARAQWPQLKEEWRTKRKQFLRTELLFLGFFVIMLLVRIGNPDLWHPAKGGEKPMNFSYFNAVLKSETFPPYDPWFAGGYINYYYWGYVLVGSLVKLLGIVPAVAYNLILPSLFAMLALGAYSVSWNLWTAWKGRDGRGSSVSPELVGIAAAMAIVLFGNLGSIQMIFQGYTRLGAEGAIVAEGGLVERIIWMARGFVMSLSGTQLPFGLGDWYWNPTRIIPAMNESSPITEFPLFTFAYADLHAHMIALPVTLLTLGWALSAILSRAWQAAVRWGRVPIQIIASFLLAAIAIGSLRPINTWDLPTYLVIAILAAVYAIVRYGPRRKGADGKPRSAWELALGAAAALGALSILAFQPFAHWYRQGYASVELWKGTHTPVDAYLIHWMIFLFFVIAWLIWETRQWMANTPLSSVRKLQPYSVYIYFGLFVLLLAIVLLSAIDVYVAWLVVPLIAWVGLLFLRPRQDEAKRLVLFLAGTALFLTLFVEIIVLKGDISRMNTVFKFYMQAWVLLAIAAAFALGWTLDALRAWLPSWRGVWQFAGAIMLACAGLFLLLGVTAKMRDRMAAEAPHTLDGLAYVQHSVYYDKDQELQLWQDYEAIRWLQENVHGSPVIVEANTPEYRWGSRMTIYTGLPGVVGWNFHQRQQREFVPGNDVWARITGEYSVEAFYNSVDLNFVQTFLQRYNAEYIVVGQLERAYYPGPGLDKFEAQDGILWNEVFRVGDTVIYQVVDTVLAEN